MCSFQLSLCLLAVVSLGRCATLMSKGVNEGMANGNLPSDLEPEVSSPLHVAQCRATCLQQILKQKEKMCEKEPECFTCWKKCELLESLRLKEKEEALGTICSSSCGEGCQVACSTHFLTERQPASSPVTSTKRESVLRLSPKSNVVSWPAVSKEGLPVVYILMQQIPHGQKWKQVTQTMSTTAQLQASLWEKLEFGLRNLRVLVVDSQGLRAIYYPEKEKSTAPVITSTTVASTTKVESRDETEIWNKMMKVEESTKTSPEVIPPTTSSISDIQEDIWDLRRLSLIHQKSLVIAELAWEPVKYSSEQEYLITWELDGGGLKGHLVTDSTTVSLSLWPDTLYHIQVELFEPNFGSDEESESEIKTPLGQKSLSLLIDTSEAAYPLLSQSQPSALSSERFITTSTLVAITVAMVLTLAAVLLAVSLRKMFSPRRGQMLLQDTDDGRDECGKSPVKSLKIRSSTISPTLSSETKQFPGAVSVISGSSSVPHLQHQYPSSRDWNPCHHPSLLRAPCHGHQHS